MKKKRTISHAYRKKLFYCLVATILSVFTIKNIFTLIRNDSSSSYINNGTKNGLICIKVNPDNNRPYPPEVLSNGELRKEKTICVKAGNVERIKFLKIPTQNQEERQSTQSSVTTTDIVSPVIIYVVNDSALTEPKPYEVLFGNLTVEDEKPKNVINNDYSDKTSFISDADNIEEKTHPLENACKYPKWKPFDESIVAWFTLKSGYKKEWECKSVLPEFVTFQESILRVNQEKARILFNSTVLCQYRPFSGTLQPRLWALTMIGEMINVTNESSEIFDDQILVKCFLSLEKNLTRAKPIFEFAYAQVGARPNSTFIDNTEDTLSVNMIVLDSTSRSAFRRHMPASWRYLTGDLKAFYLDGYFKVHDNTAVNMLPVLTGLRHGDASDDMPSDYPLDKPLDLENVPLLWNEFKEKGCATMFNDDPVQVTMGMFHYPWNHFRGFKRKPTDYWYRPWNVYHRGANRWNASRFCFGNKFSFDFYLDFAEQMAVRYQRKCYFSLSLITDIGHDNSENLKLMDENFKNRLRRLHESDVLNKTVLIVMGDHGQRIHIVKYAFLGRAEERMPLFTILFPQWFQRKYPKLMDNFRSNKNRLTSHYDVYQTLKDIAEGNYDGAPKYANAKFPRSDKGLSLLHRVVPRNRTCADVNVPENHCACLIPHAPFVVNDTKLIERSRSVIFNYTRDKLEDLAECQQVDEIDIHNITRWTLSQMVQIGIRVIQNDTYEFLSKRKAKGSVEFVEIEYTMQPINVKALIRLQHDVEHKLLFVNIDPLIIDKDDLDGENAPGDVVCGTKSNLPKFCKCVI